jgi:hypothetical protein
MGRERCATPRHSDTVSDEIRRPGLNPVSDVQCQTSVPQPDIVKQLGQKQVDVAEATYPWWPT